MAKEENRLRICTPKGMREDIMWHLHDAPTSDTWEFIEHNKEDYILHITGQE